jgi:DNA adenine methylase
MTTQTQTNKRFNIYAFAGSKRAYKDNFISLLDRKFNGAVQKVGDYVEAFAGSLQSVFNNIERVRADRYIINDLNPKFINLYKHIKENPEEVFEKYLLLEEEFNRLVPNNLYLKYRSKNIAKADYEAVQHIKDYYEAVREVYNNLDSGIEVASMFIFLMKHCNKGLYSENKKGGFDTMFALRISPVNINLVKEALFNMSNFFNENIVIFENMSAFDLFEKYNNFDTFIYLDPPYSGNNTIKYKQQQRDFLNIATHIEMLELCKKYKYVMYSNNYNEVFEKYMTEFSTFERKVNTGKSNKSRKEILGFIENKLVHKDIYELLNIQKHKPILEILKVNNIESINNTNSVKDILKKVA